jgi:hypothetical protein
MTAPAASQQQASPSPGEAHNRVCVSRQVEPRSGVLFLARTAGGHQSSCQRALTRPPSAAAKLEPSPEVLEQWRTAEVSRSNCQAGR